MRALRTIFSIPDLAQKIWFTLFLLVLCRIGAYVPVPGINGELAEKLFRFSTGGSQNLFQLVDIFSGGAFAQMTITALGVMPYISASIIMQLLVALVPTMQRDLRENPEAGKRRMGRWIRIFTLVLALFQSSLFARYALSMNASTPGIIIDPIVSVEIFSIPIFFYLVTMITMTSGTLLLMWIGEQITERGIGNGMSLVITVGILASLPSMIGSVIQQLNLESQEPGQLTLTSLMVLAVAFVLIIAGTILVIQGQRKIPLQYARRVVGRNEVHGGGTAFIPLKINYAGVIPVIFASSILMLPATIAGFVSQGGFLSRFAQMMTPGSVVYMTIYILLILFFTYFWTATQFNPEQIASEMKRGGAFIPGVRQGKPTQDYLEASMSRITLIGAVFLAIIAVLPTIVSRLLSVDQSITYFFGGTSLLILVGVILDTFKQIESHLLMKRYDGFMSQKRTR